MKPTVQNVYDHARAFLGDDGITNGQLYTNTLLQNHYQASYADMFRILLNLQVPKVQAEAFFVLPQYQTTLDPTQAGITDLGATIGMEERGSVTLLNVSNAVPGTNLCVVTTSTPHGLTDGAVICTNSIGGLTQDVNSIWGITVQDATNIRLLGCTATGTYTAATGTVALSNEEFVGMDRRDRLELGIMPTPAPTLGWFAIEGVFFRFRGATTIRQLRIIYDQSGTAPTSTLAVIPVDDSLDYLALQTAYRAARARDLDIAQGLAQDADWVIRAMANSGVRGLQGNAYRRPPFRQRRSPWALF